jgi:hypothetical protein
VQIENRESNAGSVCMVAIMIRPRTSGCVAVSMRAHLPSNDYVHGMDLAPHG